ncbi:hypothetical protein PTKIN_Ptkin01aG0050200 [Pterospermum kingtungense]
MKKPNRRSKQKSGGSDSSSSWPSIVSGDKENHDKRIRDLEEENDALKREIEELRSKIGDVTPSSCAGVKKLDQGYPQNSKIFVGKVVDLKKLGIQSQLSAQKAKSGTPKRLQDEIQRLKVQKVQLQCKMKLESMQFRLCKSSLEKEILQLKKEQRRNKYEKHVLSILNQRQKHVLQRKTEEASVAAKRLKELMQSRKASSGKIAGGKKGSKIGTQGITEHDFEFKMKLDEVCAKYENRIGKMVDEIKKLELELEMLREEKSRSQYSEAAVNDSELIDLREEVAKLSCMVSQMNLSKAQLVQADKSQIDMVQTSVSVGSNIHKSDMDISQSANSEETIALIEKPTGLCCSCSKKSLCKTLKCECRSKGSNCGMSCGCAMAKCTNREKVSFKLDDTLHPEMTEDTVPDNIQEEKATVEDAMLLENEVVEKLPKMNEDCGPRRQPFREIGNTMKTIAGKRGPRKKVQKAVLQSDTIDPPLAVLENTKVSRRSNRNSG